MTTPESSPACDKARKRHPELCVGAVHEVECSQCGDAFRRCDAHGGESGARKSRGSHKAIAHYVAPKTVRP